MAVASSAIAHDRDQLTPEFATDLYDNAQDYTPPGWAEALAVGSGVIVAVGSDEGVAQYAGATTRRMHMQGQSLLRGLHDAHVHVLLAGMEQVACGFESAASPERIAERVSDCIEQAARGVWITGANWVAAVFEAGCIRWTAPGLEGRDSSVALIENRAFCERGRFKPDCAKIELDGVSTESHIAAMLRPIWTIRTRMQIVRKLAC